MRPCKARTCNVHVMRLGVWRAIGAIAPLVALAALSGCGSSGSGAADPATVVPASAPLYASFAIKPSGGSKGAAEVGREEAQPPRRTLRQPRAGAALKRRGAAQVQARHRAVGGRGGGSVRHLAERKRAAPGRELRAVSARRGAHELRLLRARRRRLRQGHPGRDRARHERRRRAPGRSCSDGRSEQGAHAAELPGRHLRTDRERGRRGHRQELRRDRQRVGHEERDRHVARRRRDHHRPRLHEAAEGCDRKRLCEARRANQSSPRLRPAPPAKAWRCWGSCSRAPSRRRCR